MANERMLEVLGQEIKILENQYFLVNGSNDKVVLRNSTLMEIGKKFNIPRPSFEFIEESRDFERDKFSYVVKAKIEDSSGTIFEQVGEANHLNCLNDIALAHPATMAMVRATSRVLICALGLEGNIYSEDEFDKKDLRKPFTGNNVNNNADAAKQPQKTETQSQEPSKPQTMTKEQAGEVLVTVGYLAQQKAKVKDCNEKNIEYILSLKSNKYDSLKEAVKIYWDK